MNENNRKWSNCAAKKIGDLIIKLKYSRATVILPLMLFISLNLTTNILERPSNLDHWLYLVMAREVNNGNLPYLDFFLASPPGFIYSISLFFALFGAGIAAAKIYTLIIGILFICIFYTVGEREKRGLGLIASLLLASTYIFHRTAGVIDGTVITLIPIFISLFLVIEHRSLWAGAGSCAAIMMRMNAALSAASLLVYSLAKKEEKAFLKGAAFLIPVFLFLMLVPNFFSDTVLYHFGKRDLPIVKEAVISSFISKHIALIALSIISVVYCIIFKTHKKPLIWISLITILFNIFYIIVASPFFTHYLIFLAPFMCIISSSSLLSVYERDGRLCKTICIGLLMLTVWLSANEVSSLYGPPDPVYSKLESIIANESGADSGIIDFSVSLIPPYLSFATGVQIPLNYMDSGFQRVDTLTNLEEFMQEMENVDFVIWNLRDNLLQIQEGYDEAAAYVRSHFYPRFSFFVYGDILTLWERGINEPVNTEPVYEGTYKAKYLKAYINGTPSYITVTSIVHPDPVYSRYACIPCLVNFTNENSTVWGSTIIDLGDNVTLAGIKLESEANYGGERLLASGHPLILPNQSMWSTQDGDIVSDSWVSASTGNYTEIITITRRNESVISFIFIRYSKNLNKYREIAAYQLIEGSFIGVYREDS